ncbi:MAG: nicotinamidase [Nitrospinaceae bacterium]|jgi:nicotinamidase/pyrazinamidase|nr:nicotinamidase [Nitrospinaceae bacterium]MBT3434761.1 nicotinamidase [Nitrospinaceae bacterium]MBT3823065.1 nicotinamidase [Nitrospinaceae bacterium]MBT4095850.1 nicotinamidase [Nitrospinaceae bacterium]MBT4430897.1 nicotinamidase [Nitrospinaceae bacterium]
MSGTQVGPNDALVVVDLQNDFCPGGSLAVPEGDLIVPLVNRILALPGLVKVATRDWHPADHVSFKEQGGIWPPHCVVDTQGAQFQPQMDEALVDFVVSKGNRREVDAYSGFDGTLLAADLKTKDVRRIFVCGLATDYCVKATALDGRAQGLEVVVLQDTIRAVDVKPGDGERAIDEMRGAGCEFINSLEISG